MQKPLDQAGSGLQVTVPPCPLAAGELSQAALGSALGGRGGGQPELPGTEHLQSHPQGLPLAGGSQTQRAAIRDAPNPMPSTAVMFLERWSAEPSPVRCAGDTVATVKDLSGHGAAAESALQAPGEELLSPSWRVSNSTGRFLLWPRRWPLSAPWRGKTQCQCARRAGPLCQPPAPPHPGFPAGTCPGSAG